MFEEIFITEIILPDVVEPESVDVAPLPYMIVNSVGKEIAAFDCIVKCMCRFKRMSLAKNIIRRSDGEVLAYRGRVIHEPLNKVQERESFHDEDSDRT